MLWKGRQLMPPKLDLIGLCFGEGGLIVDAWVHGPTLLYRIFGCQAYLWTRNPVRLETNLGLRGLPRGDERELIGIVWKIIFRASLPILENVCFCAKREREREGNMERERERGREGEIPRETDMHVDSKGLGFELWVLDKGPGRSPGSWTRARAMCEHTACRHILPSDVS